MMKYEKREMSFKTNPVTFQPECRATGKEPGLSGLENKLFRIPVFIQEIILKIRNVFWAKTKSRAVVGKHGLRAKSQDCGFKILC